MVDNFKTSNETIDAGADNGLLAMLEFVEYDPAHALAEYVDNSIQSYLDNKDKLHLINSNYKLIINIEVKGKKIVIKDNAAGISQERFQDAFKAGKKIEKRKNKLKSLGEFNMGMKAASYWFTPTWKVITKSIEETETKLVKMNRDNIINVNSKIKVQKAFNKSKKGFTEVILENITKPISPKKFNSIKDHLASIHREFLRKDIVTINFNNDKLIFIEPEFKKNYPYRPYKEWLDKFKDNLNSQEAKKNKPTEVKWKQNIDISFGDGLRAKGYVGILLTSNPKISGFHYFRRKRCIEQNVFPQEMFSESDRGSERAKSIYGEIQFENAGTTFNKRVIEINDIDMGKFEIQLLNEMKSNNNLWAQADVAQVRYKEFEEFISQIKKGLVDTSEKYNVWKDNYDKNSASAATKALSQGREVKNHNPDDKLPPLVNPKKSINQKKDTVKIDNKTYSYFVEKTYDATNTDPWCVWDIDHETKSVRMRISMAHEFIQTFFTPTNKMQSLGLEYLATYLVTAEIHAQNHQGLGKKASLIRNNLNKILYQLPPRERKRN